MIYINIFVLFLIGLNFYRLGMEFGTRSKFSISLFAAFHKNILTDYFYSNFFMSHLFPRINPFQKKWYIIPGHSVRSGKWIMQQM